MVPEDLIVDLNPKGCVRRCSLVGVPKEVSRSVSVNQKSSAGQLVLSFSLNTEHRSGDGGPTACKRIFRVSS